MKVLITGADGQLATAVARELRDEGAGVVALGRAALDVTDDAAVAARVAAERPDLIVNGAAYNDVDGAEGEPVKALELNAFAVRALAGAAGAAGAAFVHYSTDFVFDGAAREPYTEEDPPNPLSVYASSKLLGEWFAAHAPVHYVLRVESLFGGDVVGGPARGSVANIRDALLAGRDVRVFEDRTVSPTFVVDAARATRRLVERRAAPGLYHCVNTGSCTWLEFAREMARQAGVAPRLVPVRVEEVVLRARRPAFCALSNRKLAAIGVEMPSWQDALRRYLASTAKVDDRGPRRG